MELVYAVRSLVFYIGYALGVVLFTVVVTPLCAFLDFEQRYHILSRANVFVIWWARWICGISYEIRGLENIPNKACVVVSNHQSAWETYIIGLIFQPQATVLKLELTKIPFFGWALKKANPIAIDRSKPSLALKQLLSQGKARLADNIWVVIYPEGTRVRPGEEKRYNKGAAMLAGSAKVPLLPLAHNAGSCWPAGRFIKRPGKVTIQIGTPIETVGRDREEVHREMESWIRDTTDGFNAPAAQEASLAG